MENDTSMQKMFLSIMVIAAFLLYMQYRNFQRKGKNEIDKLKNSSQKLREAYEELERDRNASEIENFWEEDKNDQLKK
tara:strand:+ start:148 stop:381 length:234 start_codon:yes stop_codon:yes gene_type:complete